MWIVYRVGTEILKRPLVGGSSVTLAEDSNPSGTTAFSWLDDGTLLYKWEDESQASPRGILRISEDGGEPLDVVYQPEGSYAPSWVQGLPGARGQLPGPLDTSREALNKTGVVSWYETTGEL